MIERILFMLLILTAIVGFLKRRKLHEYLMLLTLFSLFLHIAEKPVFSFDCVVILILFTLTFITGYSGLNKKLKIKHRIKLHITFAVLTFAFVLMHVFPTFQTFLALPSIPPTPINVTEIELPEPELEGVMSVEEALLRRRSIRSYLEKDVPLSAVSQLLWAAQGITTEWGGRTAPSAGGTYPLELYVQVRRVENLPKGIYHYDPSEHALRLVKSGDYSDELMRAGISQRWIKDASFNIVVTAEFARTTRVYGERGRQYVYLEAGHAAQNIYLQAAALNLGCVVVGAFNDAEVLRVLSAPENYEPIYIIPVGFPG